MGNIEKFDSIANRYDTIDRIEIANIISDTVRKYVIDGKDKTAIDFGCGTGLIGMQLLDVFKSVIFVDASYNMIEKVKEKIEILHVKNAQTFCSNFMEVQPQDLKADYILVVQVLLHVSDVKSLLYCLFSMLNEGGHLLIIDFDKNENIISNDVHNGFEQQYLFNILQDISFEDIESQTFYYGEKIFMNQDASLFILDAIK